MKGLVFRKIFRRWVLSLDYRLYFELHSESMFEVSKSRVHETLPFNFQRKYSFSTIQNRESALYEWKVHEWLAAIDLHFEQNFTPRNFKSNTFRRPPLFLSSMKMFKKPSRGLLMLVLKIRSTLTFTVFIVLLHAVPGLLDAFASAERPPLVNAVSRHRRIVVFRLVPVILSRGASFMGPRVLTVLVEQPLHRRTCRPGRVGGDRWHSVGWSLLFVPIVIVGITLRKQKQIVYVENRDLATREDWDHLAKGGNPLYLLFSNRLQNRASRNLKTIFGWFEDSAFFNFVIR